MGIDRRSELDRRLFIDRRFDNNLNPYKGPDKRGILDRRNHNDRRQIILQPTKIDLFKSVN